VTGAEVNIGNYRPKVGKILPEARTAEGNINPTEGQLFPTPTKAPVSICSVSCRSEMAYVKTIKYNSRQNCIIIITR